MKAYNIVFSSLKQGLHDFEYDIDLAFFEEFDYQEFNSASINAKVQLHKGSNMLELDFNIVGKVGVICDITLEPFELPIKDRFKLVVKFGEHYNDENEEILILPHHSYELNIAQYLYELSVLALPAKKIHPGIADGSLKSPILEKLKELEPDLEEQKNKNKETDPRWDALKKLL